MDARVPTRQHVPIGLIPTPFQSRLEALSRAKSWVNWAGYISPAVLDTVEFEYFAIRNQATLYDITPMHKYRVRGSGAAAMLNRLVTRDVRKIRLGRVAYVLWCDEEGHLIDDGTLFRLGLDDWRLCCQEPMAGWLADAAWGFDVSIVDESHTVAGLALQGPTSFAVLEAAGIVGTGALKPFGLHEFEPGLHISRTGFTGDLGYELWTSWGKAGALWDRLWEAGNGRGLRAIGFEAMNIARIEAGFIAARTDFQPANTAIRLGRGRSPIELGFSRMVDFSKGHFNGRRALLTQKPRFNLVRLDVGGFKPADGALIYHRKKKEVGHVTSGVWSPTAKRNIALAELRAPYGGTVADDLWAEIYVNAEGRWDRRLVPVTLQTEPFFRNVRARATPPGQF
ncbi:aminomethyltransferase family protein [Seohaeicola nanhaiensis]|uniref:Aminomethyltransferase family protein n=1 Tax=Seohaeicola nanhaiensis TaxID=1387282 RepID=A0ABV9KE81_9RHOB